MTELKEILEQKFDKKFNGKIDPFKYFFGHTINMISTLDAIDKGYAEFNFNGAHSASNNDTATLLTEYLFNNFKINTHCDIGAGNANFSRNVILKYGKDNIDCYAIDGYDYGIRHQNIQMELEKYCVFNMSSASLSDLDLEKYFDFTTAFEVTEHVPENEIKMFYDNCSYISKRHLCSVHCGGSNNAENPNHNHYNVKPVEWWTNFLSQYGEVKNPNLKPYNFGESEFLLVDFK